jgi:hypothetical protein
MQERNLTTAVLSLVGWSFEYKQQAASSRGAATSTDSARVRLPVLVQDWREDADKAVDEITVVASTTHF